MRIWWIRPKLSIYPMRKSWWGWNTCPHIGETSPHKFVKPGSTDPQTTQHNRALASKAKQKTKCWEILEITGKCRGFTKNGTRFFWKNVGRCGKPKKHWLRNCGKNECEDLLGTVLKDFQVFIFFFFFFFFWLLLNLYNYLNYLFFAFILLLLFI